MQTVKISALVLIKHTAKIPVSVLVQHTAKILVSVSIQKIARITVLVSIHTATIPVSGSIQQRLTVPVLVFIITHHITHNPVFRENQAKANSNLALISWKQGLHIYISYLTGCGSQHFVMSSMNHGSLTSQCAAHCAKQLGHI